MEKVFPDINTNFHASEQQWVSWIAEVSILTPMNSSVDQRNAIISQELLHGKATILSSADSTSGPRDSIRSMEFQKRLTPAGFPPHHLYMKEGMVLMLLRDLSPKQGLCNGTRIILNKATHILLYCKIASGDNAREEVLIPRIEIKHQDDQFIE